MEAPFPKRCNSAISLDHDSGYMSIHQESNSANSSMESLSEALPHPPARPIYLSEDALLEQPEIFTAKNPAAPGKTTSFNESVSFDIDADTILSTSVVSQRTSYSGFDESDPPSAMSEDIPYSKRIIVSSILEEDLQCSSTDSSLNMSGASSVGNSFNSSFEDESKQKYVKASSSNCESGNDTTCSSALSDVTNTCSNARNELKTTEKKRRLTLIFSKDNKENVYSVQRKSRSLTPEKTGSVQENAGNVVLDGQEEGNVQVASMIETPRKKFENPVNPNISPDLFEHEEQQSQDTVKEIQYQVHIPEEKYIVRKDQRVVRRAQNSLKGVLPPHSVTVVRFSVDEILNRLETNKEYFWDQTRDAVKLPKLNTSDENSVEGESKSLLLTGNRDCVDVKWPEILQERYHGLHYNRNKLSEEFEELCLKYGQRYVGAETQSSCTVFESSFPSPLKRKQAKPRWAVKSPGRRLSHLAKRRITFSNPSFQAAGPSSSILVSRARQILVDAKKMDLLNRRRSPRKSPRKNFRKSPRKTPSKSPRVKTRTPSSSAKKKLAMRFRELSGEIENTMPGTSTGNSVFLSKRKLFHSPDKEKPSLFQPSTSGLSFETDLKNSNTKRALFPSPSKRSPLKNSPFKASPFRRLDFGPNKKRKLSEYEDAPPSKFARSMSGDIQPSESEVVKKTSNLNKSQTSTSGELSALHKKKLYWAVYEALRSQNVTPSHDQFKVFASVLARVTRRFLLNLNSSAAKECGTTEKMLRIARYHVFSVIKGKTADEIIGEHLKSRARAVKPQGYVGPEEFNSGRRVLEVSSTLQNQSQISSRDTLDRKRLEQLGKPKAPESRIDRIRKVINFGDDNR